MNSGIPVLVISMQIPVLPDTDTSQVLDAIAAQVSQALDAIREQQADLSMNESVEQEPRTVVTTETVEPLTDETKNDLLSALGYASVTEN